MKYRIREGESLGFYNLYFVFSSHGLFRPLFGYLDRSRHIFRVGDFEVFRLPFDNDYLSPRSFDDLCIIGRHFPAQFAIRLAKKGALDALGGLGRPDILPGRGFYDLPGRIDNLDRISDRQGRDRSAIL